MVIHSKSKKNVRELFPEIHKALSSTGYPGETVKINYSDILMMNDIKNDLGYTDIGDKSLTHKNFHLIDLPSKIERNSKQNHGRTQSKGQWIKNFNPSNMFDINTKLDVFLGFYLSSPTYTLTEASNLIAELYKREKYKINNIEKLLINFVLIKRNH